MKTDAFIELLNRNNESELKEWIDTHGKKRKSVSPIFFFDDLPKSDLEEIEKALSIKEVD